MNANANAAQLHARLVELARARHEHGKLEDQIERQDGKLRSLEAENEKFGIENATMHDQLREQAAFEVRAQYFARHNELLQEELRRARSTHADARRAEGQKLRAAERKISTLEAERDGLRRLADDRARASEQVEALARQRNELHLAEAEKQRGEHTEMRAKLKSLARKHDEHKLEAERVQHLLSEIASLKGGTKLSRLCSISRMASSQRHTRASRSLNGDKLRTDGLEKKVRDLQRENDELRRKMGRQEIEEDRTAIHLREIQQMRDEIENQKQQVGAHAERVSVASKNLTAAENDRAARARTKTERRGDTPSAGAAATTQGRFWAPQAGVRPVLN